VLSLVTMMATLSLERPVMVTRFAESLVSALTITQEAHWNAALAASMTQILAFCVTGIAVPSLPRLVMVLICVVSDVLILALLAALLVVPNPVSIISHAALIIIVIGTTLLMLARLVTGGICVPGLVWVLTISLEGSWIDLGGVSLTPLVVWFVTGIIVPRLPSPVTALT
jgi:hypothetical protein